MAFSETGKCSQYSGDIHSQTCFRLVVRSVDSVPGGQLQRSFSPFFWHENPASNFLLALVPVPNDFPGTL